MLRIKKLSMLTFFLIFDKFKVEDQITFIYCQILHNLYIFVHILFSCFFVMGHNAWLSTFLSMLSGLERYINYTTWRDWRSSTVLNNDCDEFIRLNAMMAEINLFVTHSAVVSWVCMKYLVSEATTYSFIYSTPLKANII